MIQVRQTAELLLKQSGIQITREGDILPFDTIDYNSDLEQEYSQQEEEEEEEGDINNDLKEVCVCMFNMVICT